MVCHSGGTHKVALYALIFKQFCVYNYSLDDKQDNPDAFVDEGENKKLIERYVPLLFY